MSLLMQALKKAERAKQNSLPDEELEKPSEAYDQVLELAPADAVPLRAAPPPPAAPEAPSTLSLEPLPGAPAASGAAPTPPPLETPRPPPPEPAAAQSGPRPETPRPRSEAPASKPRAANGGANGASRSKTPPRGPISVDPATVRLAVLLGILLLVAASMAYWYWRASSSPGAGASLPGVPMPLTDAPGTTDAAGPIVVQAAVGAPLAPAAQELPPPDARREERPGASAAEQQAMIQAAAQAAVAAQLAQMPPPAPPSLPPVVAPDNSQIQVLRNDTAPQINPGVQQAYQALNGGQLGTARRQYETVLQQDANNRDALLGLAAVALRENQGAQAAALYVRLLEINPDDGEALAGLIGLRQGDVVQSEAKLKAILARAPDSGPVLFALGNVYAKQRRWPEAQQQFFRAYSAVPGNPDYAFNLAVGLDRLNQPKLAATYYQRALVLAQATPAAFERAVVQARLRELGSPAPMAAGTSTPAAAPPPASVIIRQE